MDLTKHLKVMYNKNSPQFKKVYKLGKNTCSKELRGAWLIYIHKDLIQIGKKTTKIPKPINQQKMGTKKKKRKKIRKSSKYMGKNTTHQ